MKTESEKTSYLEELKKIDPQLVLDLLEDPTSSLRHDQFIELDTVENILVQAGRGWGKSYCGAFFIRQSVSMGYTKLAIVGATHQDLVKIMVPALLKMFPKAYQPVWNKSDGIIYLPNGGQIMTYTSEKEIRGGDIEKLWMDELCAFCGGTIPSKVYDMYNTMDFAVRAESGKIIQRVITSTPKPWKIFRDFTKFCENPKNKDWKMIGGSIFDNPVMAHNGRKWIEKYKGTTLEQQEIYGKLISKEEGALWTEDVIERSIVERLPENLFNYVIALDPATSNNSKSDQFGICVAASHVFVDEFGKQHRHAYVVEDATGKYSVDQWTQKVNELSKKYDTKNVIAESNQGGNMIAQCVREKNAFINVKLIHAFKSKIERATPVSFLFQQGKVKLFHNPASSQQVNQMQQLEQQMLTFDGSGKSPDKLDAMVYAITEIYNVTVYRAPYRDLSLLPY